MSKSTFVPDRVQPVIKIPTADEEPVPPAFPIVGIGASAGGLEAISELISTIPRSSGLSFLVVQHLDPSRHSLLPDILTKHTAMPVVEAIEGMAIEADHVYVIPPNARMRVAQRRISLQPRDDILGPPMPIDDLLESLASDQGTNAIGVILSGSGSDGALGLKAIQNEGGITFAQDEASARFASMPQAAIGTGCVDLVLPPRQIAEEIARIGRQPHSGPDQPMPASQSQAEKSLRHVFRLLHKACNVDFTHYKRGTVERRLSRRMALRQISSIADYVVVLESDAAEVLALGRDLLIRVTEFFRDPETFEALVQIVFPKLLGDREPGMPIRLWIPGCATGEEVYSIAICLIEYLGERAADTPIQIFGTDVSVDALEIARAGRYIENIARNVSSQRLQRFFIRDGDYYRLDKRIRDLCTFARHNVATDPPFSRMDLVSCRNLLIYLNPVLQRNVMPLFHYALRADGVLMLGPSETVGAFSDLFGVIESKRTKLYSKKPRPGHPGARSLSLMSLPESAAQPTSSTQDRREPPLVERLGREASRKALARYAPPYVLCDDELNIIEFHGDTGPYLVNPEGPPSSNLQRLARPEVFLAISEAVRQARQSGAPLRRTGLSVETAGSAGAAGIEVHQIQIAGADGRWFIVFFEGAPQRTAESGQPAFGDGSIRSAVLRTLKRGLARTGEQDRGVQDAEIARLRAELDATRNQLRATIEEHESAREELKSSEEELLSSNEEFQSTNEELETAKEELQSVNEELSTTNDELRYRVRELKTVHDEVARARDYAEAIIETIAEPVLVLEADLRIARANRAFYQAFATTAEATIGTKLYLVGNGQWDIPALRTVLEEVLPEQTSVRDYEITHEFPRIGMRTMRLNAMRIAWPAQALVLLTIQDMTQQRDAVTRLEAADHQKDEFLAMLAHELRNPLAAIRNGLQLWQRGDADDASIKAAQAAAQRQLANEIGLVDDLLDVSRITRGIITLKVQRIDLVDAIRHAIETMEAEIGLRQHELILELPEESVTVEGDAMRLEQIVTNLLGNAIKYTPAGGRIQLSLERDRHDVVLSVTDNGIGMTAEFIPTIFRIFVQAERTTDRRGGGLGLGLTLVRRLVELHRGSVRASSDGLDRGSRFVVRLPALPSGAAPERSPNSGRSAKGPTATHRILIVDDNVDAGESSAAVLRLDGHEVKVLCDGPSALQSAEDFRPDVVLLDIGLPGMDGYEVAQQLRTMPVLADAVLIALSGYGGEQHAERCRQAGFDCHLVKPANLEQLDALIESCRSRRTLANSAR
jgi:two-component system, chemotaxis family, CheB/CheR fusion protein